MEQTQRERLPVRIHRSSGEACREVAEAIDALIRGRNKEGRTTVLGLATGSTPVGLYRELIRRHREEGLSFERVVTFNLDEYYGLPGDHPESYRQFMQDQLFGHVDIRPENTHVPDGLVDREEVFASCRKYEESILQAGGIDIQIPGIGFNEPGSGPESRTRLVTLDNLTRRDAARDFLGEENVPRHAITMGIGTILEARKVFLLAWGESKAGVIAQAIEGDPTEALPASFLQAHQDCQFHIDEAASSQLTRIRHPWLVGPVEWSPGMTRKAVLWLARKTGKALLKLVDEDYTENGMADLLTEQGSAYNLNIHIFNTTQHTITGWPGGKPEADDSHRPERASPYPKRVLVLSPEPMDDVYCMGGTLHRLAKQGHEVTVAYQTSGSLAVPDSDLRRAIELLVEAGEGLHQEAESRFGDALQQQLEEKGAFGEDGPDLRFIKALIRRGEARASCRLLEVDLGRVRFLDLPFYETGRYRRFHTGEADVAAIVKLLEVIRPHQIFATGHGHDPLSVPALSFQVFSEALAQCGGSGWLDDCRIWLYRGPGAEWEAHEIDMAVPLSPDEFENKLHGLYQHQTQRSQSPSMEKGTSSNTWNLASQINRTAARTYDGLGLAEYEAMECFRRWIPENQSS